MLGALTIPKAEAARTIVQYPVIYHFNEFGRRHSKGFAAVTLTKKCENTESCEVKKMNGNCTHHLMALVTFVLLSYLLRLQHGVLLSIIE